MGFTYPSKIQETALPTLLADPPQNMIAQSQSGTGKTAAFTLAALSRVDTSIAAPQVCCVAFFRRAERSEIADFLYLYRTLKKVNSLINVAQKKSVGVSSVFLPNTIQIQLINPPSPVHLFFPKIMRTFRERFCRKTGLQPAPLSLSYERKAT